MFMSLVVPAYNEEDRLGTMLTEAVDYLEQEYGSGEDKQEANGKLKKRSNGHVKAANGHAASASLAQHSRGWEVLIISDGSTDKTIATALQFARSRGIKASESIRVVALQENRGKGGAVVHGMRHVRGRYAVFADADGASKFPDLGKLVQACQKIEDAEGRGVAVGSRAHLVGSEAVVQVRSYQFIEKTNLIIHSALGCETSSCIPSTYFSASSRHPPPPPYETHNAASNSSPVRRYRISYRSCMQNLGSSMLRCSCLPNRLISLLPKSR